MPLRKTSDCDRAQYNYKTKAFDNNIESPAQVRKLNADLQQAYQESNLKHHRPIHPLLIAVDYEGGKVNRLKPEYGFPETYPAAAVGRMGQMDADKAAHDMAVALQQSGFNLNFAPVMDVNINPDGFMAKSERMFSNNPDNVAFYASLYSQNFLSQGVQCAFKHFPGHGSAAGDSHLGFVDISDTWQPLELEPYSRLLNQEQSCGMVMTAHVVNRQLDASELPATLSHKVLTGLLREQLHFKGVIITDDMQMKAISAQYALKDAVTLAINAGADMFIFGNQLSEQPQDPKVVIDLIEGQVKAGKISKQRINDAYQRITAMKATMG